MKNRLAKVILDGVFAVGMSTVNSISRFNSYEPEEDVELAKWAEQKSEHEVN